MNIAPRYDLSPGTELTVNARAVVIKCKTDHGYVAADQASGREEFIPYVMLARLLKQPGLSLKKPMSTVSAKAVLRLKTYETVEALPSKQQEQGAFRLAICGAIAEIHEAIRQEKNDPDYELSQRKLNDLELRERIAKLASTYFGKRISVHAPSGGNRLVWQLPKGRSLNELYNAYLGCVPKSIVEAAADPIAALISLDHLKGNRRRRIGWLIRDMMTESIEHFAREAKEYSIANIQNHLTTEINTANKKRQANDLPPLQTPSQTTLSRHRQELFSTTEAEIRDKGERAARSKLGRGSTDIRALMIGELTEIDEVHLSLVVTAKVCGLWEKLGDPEKRALEDADNIIKTRLTLLVMLDVATRMPLAWVISDEPRAEATLALLRMATRDKSKEKIRYGCSGLVADAVGLGMVKTDNGPGLRNAAVKSAVLGAGGVSVDVRVYSPTDKPFIERHFGTLESVLLKLLHGYTGRRPGDLPGYDANKNGVLDIDTLYQLLTCFYIDELPSMRHHGFGMWGRRPAEVYEEVYKTREIFEPMDPDLRRIHLCWEEKVIPTSEGVRVFSGIWFNSPELQQAIEDTQGYERSGQRQVSVYVDPDNLNEATVVLPRTTAPIRVQLQSSVFADMTINEVLHLVRAYRKEDPTTTEIHEDRLAKVRRERRDLLDSIGVEKGLARSYQTRAEIKAKARQVFQGARIVASKGVAGAASAGHITAARPDGRIFDFTGGNSILEGKAVDPAPIQPHEMNAEFMTDEASEPIPPKAAGKKRASAQKPKIPSPPAEPPKEFFGRPANIKRLE
jgi:putative transposase